MSRSKDFSVLGLYSSIEEADLALDQLLDTMEELDQLLDATLRVSRSDDEPLGIAPDVVSNLESQHRIVRDIAQTHANLLAF